MKAPQIDMICFMVLNLWIGFSQHGKEKTSKESFWVSLIAVIIQTGILIWGGFFG